MRGRIPPGIPQIELHVPRAHEAHAIRLVSVFVGASNDPGHRLGDISHLWSVLGIEFVRSINLNEPSACIGESIQGLDDHILNLTVAEHGLTSRNTHEPTQ